MVERIVYFGHGETDVNEYSAEILGGKGANLLELSDLGLPVPPGFVITTELYREFLRERDIVDELAAVVQEEPRGDDHDSVQEAVERLVLSEELPEVIRRPISEAYAKLGEDTPVAVRSSATAEDQSGSSFAGQLETYLNISGPEAVFRSVKMCWASLFTERASVYRSERGHDPLDIDVAVVVQRMIDAEKSGVLFTAHPTSGERETIIEASWGLGEAVVSGAVSPDKYTVGRGEVDDPAAQITTEVNEKDVMFQKHPETGETVKREVPDEKRTQRVLTEAEILELNDLGKTVESHFGSPQDVEWAITTDEVYVLQTRPITTITEQRAESRSGATGEVLAEGLGVSPGTAYGEIHLTPISAVKASKAGEDVILVREQTSPSDMPGIKAANGVLTSQGGMTSHAAIVSREMEKPTIVGCEALEIDMMDGAVELGGKTFEEGDPISIDSDHGLVLTERNGDD